MSIGDIERVYSSRCRGFSRALLATGDVEAASDAVHDAFAQAIASREQIPLAFLERWIWRTAIRKATRSSRRARRLVGSEYLDRLVSAEELPDERVRSAVAALPPRRRLVVFLRYWAELDYAEVAELLGISAGTVAATLAAAHASLRTPIEEVRR